VVRVEVVMVEEETEKVVEVAKEAATLVTEMENMAEVLVEVVI
tara:strand:+ start:43 stop:171 length:129 start_codon:yes stop_codon:yes gene_type:complete